MPDISIRDFMKSFVGLVARRTQDELTKDGVVTGVNITLVKSVLVELGISDFDQSFKFFLGQYGLAEGVGVDHSKYLWGSFYRKIAVDKIDEAKLTSDLLHGSRGDRSSPGYTSGLQGETNMLSSDSGLIAPVDKVVEARVEEELSSISKDYGDWSRCVSRYDRVPRYFNESVVVCFYPNPPSGSGFAAVRAARSLGGDRGSPCLVGEERGNEFPRSYHN